MLSWSLLLACTGPSITPEIPPTPPPPPSTAPTTSGEAVGGVNDGLVFKTETYKKNEGDCEKGCVSVSVSWPVFSGTHAEILNAWVQKVARLGVEGKPLATVPAMGEQFVSGWKAALTERPDFPMGWDLERSLSIEYADANVISLIAFESAFTGGAHPNPGLEAATFDRKTGAQLTLDSLLKPGWQATLRPLITRGLIDEYGDNGASLQEIGFDVEEDGAVKVAKHWTVGAKGLTLHYNAYEIGPYVLGTPTVVLSRAQLGETLRPDSVWK